MKLSEKAKSYALQCHEETNHTYDGKPYAFHLQMVVNAAEEFLQDQYTEAQKELIRAGCWLHDVIEDCRQTYNDVKKVVGVEAAEIAYALTNEKGRNRQERANDKYYQGIRETPLAAYIKLCDRIANVRHSQSTGSRMFEAYRRENPEFIAKVHIGEETEPLVRYLQSILN